MALWGIVRCCEPFVIAQPFSFARFIDELFAQTIEDFEDLRQNVERIELNSRALLRIFSLMRKMGAMSFVYESVDINDDIELLSEYNTLSDYFDCDPKMHAIKFTFLAQIVEDSDDLKEVENDYFLSSFTLVHCIYTWENSTNILSYIANGVVAIPQSPIELTAKGVTREPLLNNYIHVSKKFPLKLTLKDGSFVEFTIKGTFFCQQNGKTSACAHAALRMLINTISDKYITTQDINCVLKDTPTALDYKHLDEQGVSAGHPGLDSKDIEKVVRRMGMVFEVLDFFEHPNYDYIQHTHRMIESSHATLLGFTTSDSAHVVPIFGHTLNSDMWRPEAEYAYHRKRSILRDDQMLEGFIPAAAWVDHLIVHDDNFGPYYCLNVDSLKRVTLPKHDPSFRAYLVLGFSDRPIERLVPSYKAEIANVTSLEVLLTNGGIINPNYWIRTLQKVAMSNGDAFVVRTALITKETYCNHLKQQDLSDFDGARFTNEQVSHIESRLPELFYLSEITTPDLYASNGDKVADVLCPCEGPIPPQTVNLFWLLENTIMVRLPGLAHFPMSGGRDDIPLDPKGHYPLFRVDPEAPCKSW